MFKTTLKKSLSFRIIASTVNLCFIASFISPVRSWAQGPADLGMPKPGAMISLTSAYVPVIAKGLRVHPENPILFDFIVDSGNSNLKVNDLKLRSESEKLIKYFLASLTIPDDDQWVNLSPYEKDRIIPEQLGLTEMGRDMLAQDYILKQLTASLIYPEKEIGKEFWNKVYAKAQQMYGNTQIPVNTFNKVWITADKADVYVHDNTAYVVGAHLKVMLEEDYLALNKQTQTRGHVPTGINKNVSPSTLPTSQALNVKAPQGNNQTTNETNQFGSQIVREVVLPELEKEVNSGKNFATLRQMFYSMILATWYKKNLKEALLSQVYANKSKINGVDVEDKTIKEQIYQQYLKAYKKGVFNYIKEEVTTDPDSKKQGILPKKYFSGGLSGMTAAMVVVARLSSAQTANLAPDGDMFSVSTAAQPAMIVTGLDGRTRPETAHERILEKVKRLKENGSKKREDDLYREVVREEENTPTIPDGRFITTPAMSANELKVQYLAEAKKAIALLAMNSKVTMEDVDEFPEETEGFLRVIEENRMHLREMSVKFLAGKDVELLAAYFEELGLSMVYQNITKEALLAKLTEFISGLTLVDVPASAPTTTPAMVTSGVIKPTHIWQLGGSRESRSVALADGEVVRLEVSGLGERRIVYLKNDARKLRSYRSPELKKEEDITDADGFTIDWDGTSVALAPLSGSKVPTISSKSFILMPEAPNDVSTLLMKIIPEDSSVLLPHNLGQVLIRKNATKVGNFRLTSETEMVEEKAFRVILIDTTEKGATRYELLPRDAKPRGGSQEVATVGANQVVEEGDGPQRPSSAMTVLNLNSQSPEELTLKNNTKLMNIAIPKVGNTQPFDIQIEKIEKKDGKKIKHIGWKISSSNAPAGFSTKAILFDEAGIERKKATIQIRQNQGGSLDLNIILPAKAENNNFDFQTSQGRFQVNVHEIRKDALATYIKPKGQPVILEDDDVRTRTINFDNLFTLKSRYEKSSGTTRHELSGYGLTPMLVSETSDTDETRVDWRSLVTRLEDGIDANGVPYRDGFLPGNAYFNRMSQTAIEDQIQKYEEAGGQRQAVSDDERGVRTAYSKAKSYIDSLRRAQTPQQYGIETIDSKGKITFGVALIEEKDEVSGKQKQRIIIESGFLDQLDYRKTTLAKETYLLLERAFVYILNRDTHENNNIQAYEFVKKSIPDLRAKLKADSGKDFEEIYHNMVEFQVSQMPNRDRQMESEIRRKFKESFWGMALHAMDGEMEVQRIRETEQDAKFTDEDSDKDIRIATYSSALNPLHFGQLEALFRGMDQLKIGKTYINNHAFDYRKQGKGLNPTFAKRNKMLMKLIELSGGLLGEGLVLKGSEADGETKFEELIRLNEGRKGKLDVVYLAVGGDHMHLDAPSDELDGDGNRKPKMNGPNPQPDTVRKALEINQRQKAIMDKYHIKAIWAFNFRELYESLPMPHEVDELKQLIETGFIQPLWHVNLFNTSSTNVRDFYSGQDKDITFLPRFVDEYINNDGEYRGWIIQLPYALKRLASGQGTDKDKKLFKHWLKDERERQREHDPKEIAEMFTFTERQLRESFSFIGGSLEAAEAKAGVSFRDDLIDFSEEEIQRALAAADSAQVSDKAEIVPSNLRGGIDFNSKNLVMGVNGETINIKFDPAMVAQFQRGDFSGVRPVILGIIPLTSVLPLLGLKEEETTERLAKV